MKYAHAIRHLARHVISAAKDGQVLPRLTVALAFHFALHLALFSALGTKMIATLRPLGHSQGLFSAYLLAPDIGSINVRDLSVCVLAINIALNILGYTLTYKLYQHSVATIFNRISPRFPSSAFVSSFGAHVALLRPLEVAFRYLTARFRVLPDVIVLGEVRCGTTTLCQHLSELPGCYKPFCLWKHPELDGKETFYFVGHYLGYVTPLTYRMCFPLKVTKWWNERILRRPFFTYDGCAQYLTSPTAAALIAETYRRAGQDPPVLIACVRDPVDQAVSWWRYENNAMEWGSSMGFAEWNTDLRGASYPPRTIAEALEFSTSKTVEKMYSDAEGLVKLPRFSTSSCSSLDKSMLACKYRYQLPPWSMTWPGGQLSSIGRNFKYATNVLRYEAVFEDVFTEGKQFERQPGTRRDLDYMTVVPIEHMAVGLHLRNTLSSIMKKVTSRQYRDFGCRKIKSSHATMHKSKETELLYQDSIRTQFQGTVKLRRNSGTKLTNGKMEPDAKDRILLSNYFAEETTKLSLMTGLNCEEVGWLDGR